MPPRTQQKGVACLTKDPRQAQAREEYFKTLTTSIAEVAFDIELFIQKYFTDKNGTPDQSRIPEAIVLSGLTATQQGKLEKAAEKVPDLMYATRGFNEYKAFYLGWSKEAIVERSWKFAREKVKQTKQTNVAGVERADGVEQSREQKRAEKHQKYLQKLNEQPDHAECSIVGSYTIACPSIDEEWDYREEMMLDVKKTSHEGVFEAAFCFRVLEGVMLLSTDRALLIAHRNSVERWRTKDKDWDWDYLQDPSPSHEQEDADNNSQADAGANKRKAPGVAGPKPKKRRSAFPQIENRKFWLMWAGRETGEGEIQHDDGMNHTGCIEFSDDRFTSFRAEMNLGFVTGDHKFSGRKLSDQPSKKRGTAWRRFSGGAYE